MKPFHVVNMALNLVKGEEPLLGSKGKPESFTATPLHCWQHERRLCYPPNVIHQGPTDPVNGFIRAIPWLCSHCFQVVLLRVRTWDTTPLLY